MLESWSVLAALARETRSMRLGTLVTGVTYRNPAVLAKTATTLDVISGGRAILGLGAAWFEGEHEAFGFDFPPVRERMDRLDEALTIAKAMFTEERPTFHGRYYRIEAVLNVPRPIQPGGPRIMVGGGGEQRTLRIAATHADMTHWFPLGFDVLSHKTEVLARYCEAIGRDPSTIERTMAAPVVVTRSEAETAALLERTPPERRPYLIAGGPERCAEGLRPYLDAGFTGFTFNNTLYRSPDQIAAVGELLRLVRGSGASG
jgi:F420-dependent oxidoreductase-like protein